MGIRRTAARFWNGISTVDTLVGIAGWPMWKLDMAMVGAIAGAIVSVVASVPIWAWFVLIVFGIGGSLFISNEWASARLRKHGSTPVQKDKHQTSDSPWVRYFDRFFQIDINQMLFRGLWKDDVSSGPQPNAEPFLGFQLVVRNNTPLVLNITGCDGRASVDGDICAIPARLESESQERLAPWSYCTPTIRQYLLAERGRELIQKAETGQVIRFSLGSIRMLVESQDGTIPNRPMAVGVAFNVDPTGLSVGRNGTTKTPLMLKRQ